MALVQYVQSAALTSLVGAVSLSCRVRGERSHFTSPPTEPAEPNGSFWSLCRSLCVVCGVWPFLSSSALCYSATQQATAGYRLHRASPKCYVAVFCFVYSFVDIGFLFWFSARDTLATIITEVRSVPSFHTGGLILERGVANEFRRGSGKESEKRYWFSTCRRDG